MNKIEKKICAGAIGTYIFAPNFHNTLFHTLAISRNIFETSLHSSKQKNAHHINRDSNSTSEQYQPNCAIFVASRMFLTKGNQKPRK